VIEGSNMAECHPVGFQWVVEARKRGARIIHVDPRFTRTSALADLHVPIRPGTDIAWLGGLINHVLQTGSEFREYVVKYTNAATILTEEFRDTEDLGGVFSGYDPESGTYEVASWRYEGMELPSAAGEREQAARAEQSHGAHGAALRGGEPPSIDETLEHPRCVFQVLKRHFARYTPEFVERVCGVRQDVFRDVAETLVANSGRERTSAIVYSVGWTHRTTGVQYIRAASILQLLLGNIGRPGGGILALRGHASIQGSTDIPTLYNILPGYLPMPHAGADESLDDYVEHTTAPGGYWGHVREYMVSLLKAWWGENATSDNDFGFGWLPRISGDHSIYPTVMGMRDGEVEGFFVMGENPAVGSANAKLHRLGMANLKWLVVRDFGMVETATFWKDGPEIDTGELRAEDIGTEIFFLPAAAHTEKDGSFTNTHRLLQWHHAALDPPGDCRSELWFMYHLVRRVREKLAASDQPRDRPVQALAWDLPTHGPHDEPNADAVLREISGFEIGGSAVSGYEALKSDGSTACGCWIYSGVYADETNQAARRKPRTEQDRVAAEWGWAWPMNRRILYNRASADPAGRPWSERKRYVWWDDDEQQWTGSDVPDFKVDKAPGYIPEDGAEAEMALRGDEPFIMQADGKGWLHAPTGLTDGPMPAHYEPHESPVPNALYPEHSANPGREVIERPDNPSNPSFGEPGTDVFPYVLTTYRIAEHHTAGGMSRTLPYLAELAPEPFVEVSAELAATRGLVHNGWATIVTSRSAVEARVMVTDRISPLTIEGRRVEQVGLPYHWGRNGLARGDSANDLLPIVMDSNVQISEFKAATCDIRPGRRPRGPALLELVERYRREAGI
jgi:formate dehydrogenase major subunit